MYDTFRIIESQVLISIQYVFILILFFLTIAVRPLMQIRFSIATLKKTSKIAKKEASVLPYASFFPDFSTILNIVLFPILKRFV